MTERHRNNVIHVTAPARLHLGFMDLNGGLGRRFGSLGLTLGQLATEVRLEAAAEFSAIGPQSARAAAYARHMQEYFGLPAQMQLTVLRAIPEHVGLGSGTQLALATGMAISRFFDLGLSGRDVANLLDRGGRSGIGVGAFETGGFVVDGGKGSEEAPPPVLARLAFPANWRILLITDRNGHGVHGSQEAEAFRQLPPFPAGQAAHLCRLVLMQVLPALQTQDVQAFGQAITQLQNIVGDYFAPAQGGRFASQAVAGALDWLREEGVAGVGQSSWGPTGFAIVESEFRARQLLQSAQQLRTADSPLAFSICSGRNQGGLVTESMLVPDSCLSSVGQA